MDMLAFILITVGFFVLGIIIAYIIVPINWPNTRAKKFLRDLATSADVPNHDMRLDVEHAVTQVFHQDIRSINNCIMPHDQSWAFASVTIDYVDSGEEPSYWKAETSYHIFMRRLSGIAPEIALDQRGDSSFNLMYTYGWKIQRGELVYCEAVFMDRFRVYCHPGQEAEVLSLLAPDALITVLDHMTGTDMYIVDNYLFCIMPNFHISRSKIERIYTSTAIIADELNTNLPRVQSVA